MARGGGMPAGRAPSPAGMRCGEQGLIVALPHCRPGEVARLAPIGEDTARTVALARTGSFEAVHLVVRAGQSIAPHRVAGSMTLHCIAGHVRFDGASKAELRASDWLFLAPGTEHALEALTDASLLLTILFDEPAAGD
jgi:quercetin dioxygenase-like cupin family protein